MPEVPTLVIRIFDSYPDCLNSPNKKLKDSPLYTILNYTFDDQDVDTLLEHEPDYYLDELAQNHVLLNEDLAKKMLNDFERSKNGCLDLIIHCTLGGSRSPAVAIALNEIFALGYDTDKLKEKHSIYNKFVYRLLKEARS